MEICKKKTLIIVSVCSVVLAAAWMLRPNNPDVVTAIQPTVPEGDVLAPVNDPVPNLTPWIGDLTQSLEEGVVLAKKRGVVMRDLIQANPEEAIRQSLSLSTWSQLPPEIQAHVEQPFSVVADIDVLIACDEHSSHTGIRTDLPGEGKIATYVYGRRGGIGAKRDLPVQGIRVGDVGALRENIFQQLDAADEKAALELYPVAIENPGGRSIAALAGGNVFYFKDQAAFEEANERLAAIENLPSPNAGAQLLFNALDAYISDAGAIDYDALDQVAQMELDSWTGTPRDMYVILVDFSDLQGQPTDPVALSNSLNTTISQQIWEMSYEKTHIIATVNPTTYRMSGVSTSYIDTLSSYPNADSLHLNATTLAEADGVDLSSYETVCVFFANISGMGFGGLANINGDQMWINGTTSEKTLVHELGHNYGARHADFWQVASSDPVDPAGSETGYGDFTDIMGSGSVPSGHFNAWHKKHISWFDAENWTNVTSSASYRVYRSDHYQTTGLLRGLEIDKGAGDHYWVGLRQEITGYDTFSRGAYVLWKMSGDNESDLLDMTPTSGDGKYDGGLALGQTYSDTTDDVHITPTARGGQTPDEWMDITVNLGAFGGNAAPSASLSGPSSASVQSSVIYSVTASDPDGDELAYYWDVGDGLVKPNSPSIATAWIAGSTATVTCVVSDMKGGTDTVSQGVALSSPLDNWTSRTSGTTTNLVDIAVGGSRIVAVTDEEATLYSDDGTNWVVHSSFDIWPGNVFLNAIIYDGSQFVAAGMDYDGGWEQTTYTSSDGTSWTERYDSNSASGSNIRLNDVAYGGGVYVAVGTSGTIVRSTNSISWSPVTSGVITNLNGVSYGDGLFVAVGASSSGGSAVSLTSSDGENWTNESAGIDLDSWKGFYDLEYCNDRFLGGGWYARIMHSTDQGETFTTSMAGDRHNIPAFAYGSDVYFAAGINKDNGNADINFLSLDGVNWSELTTTSQADRNAVAYYNGTFITVGSGGSIWQSDVMSAGGGSGFAGWQLANGEALGPNRDPLDDADFDGHVNLLEYALGTTATDSNSVPSSGVESTTGTYFQVSFDRSEIKTDVDYTVNHSVNLLSNDWSSVSTVVVEDSATNLTVRSSLPISSQTNEFLKLDVELQ